MDHRTLEKPQRDALLAALRGNVGGQVLVMNSDTSFAGVSDDVVEDAQVVNRIKSVPTHY